MVPSLESSGDEGEEVEIKVPSQQELRWMKRITERRDRNSRRRQDSKVRMMSNHGCSRKCECGERI
eukprot:5012478-Karenia_brevis.AAC.1